jgi:branched-subunit amino acid transport protein
VPPAVLSAIILPEMLIHNGQVTFTLANPRLFAGILAILVAWRFRSTFLTIIAGMLCLYGLLYLLGH